MTTNLKTALEVCDFENARHSPSPILSRVVASDHIFTIYFHLVLIKGFIYDSCHPLLNSYSGICPSYFEEETNIWWLCSVSCRWIVSFPLGAEVLSCPFRTCPSDVSQSACSLWLLNEIRAAHAVCVPIYQPHWAKRSWATQDTLRYPLRLWGEQHQTSVADFSRQAGMCAHWVRTQHRGYWVVCNTHGSQMNWKY